MRRDSAPRRGEGQGVTGTLEASIGSSRGAGTPTAMLSHWDGDQYPHPTSGTKPPTSFQTPRSPLLMQ